MTSRSSLVLNFARIRTTYQESEIKAFSLDFVISRVWQEAVGISTRHGSKT